MKWVILILVVTSIWLVIFMWSGIEPVAKNLLSPIISTRKIIPQSSPKNIWTVLITGDIIPSRVTNQRMVEKQDFMWPLRNIQHVLSDADVTLINLEAPLLANCPLTNVGFKFCGDAHFAKSLVESGIDVANIANNHTLNYGWEGLQETQEQLEKVGIVTHGFNALPVILNLLQDPQEISDQVRNDNCIKDTSCSSFLIKEITLNPASNLKLGFLGYNAVGQTVDKELVKQQVETADKLVDVLIVSIHWGKEYVRDPVRDPSLAPDDPREIGHALVDWGADIVVGNHPHWYQGLEFVEGKVIIYALGNTVFDQEWSLETKRGALLKLFFDGTKITDFQIFPIGIRDYGEAYLLDGEQRMEIENFYNQFKAQL